jgi:hypothetical protein
MVMGIANGADEARRCDCSGGRVAAMVVWLHGKGCSELGLMLAEVMIFVIAGLVVVEAVSGRKSMVVRWLGAWIHGGERARLGGVWYAAEELKN